MVIGPTSAGILPRHGGPEDVNHMRQDIEQSERDDGPYKAAEPQRDGPMIAPATAATTPAAGSHTENGSPRPTCAPGPVCGGALSSAAAKPPIPDEEEDAERDLAGVAGEDVEREGRQRVDENRIRRSRARYHPPPPRRAAARRCPRPGRSNARACRAGAARAARARSSPSYPLRSSWLSRQRPSRKPSRMRSYALHLSRAE